MTTFRLVFQIFSKYSHLNISISSVLLGFKFSKFDFLSIFIFGQLFFWSFIFFLIAHWFMCRLPPKLSADELACSAKTKTPPESRTRVVNSTICQSHLKRKPSLVLDCSRESSRPINRKSSNICRAWMKFPLWLVFRVPNILLARSIVNFFHLQHNLIFIYSCW